MGRHPRWQFFSGCVYYEDRQPCDATTLVKFRQLLGEEGVEELLAQTINVAVELKLSKPQELARVTVGARAFHGNPYDVHNLSEQLEQASILMQDRVAKPTTAFVDLGYRGVDADNPDVHTVHRGKTQRIGGQDKALLKRRQAIEPIIGHRKADHGMQRCHLKGETGDRLHALLCAAGYNIQWLLRMIAKKGEAFLRAFLCLQKVVAPALPWPAVVAVWRSA